MAQYINTSIIDVAANANVPFTTDAVINTNPSIMHRAGSGIITLRGLTRNCYARFKVFFSGNIAVPTGGTASAISLAVAINGEPLSETIMASTPTAAASYNNVSTMTYVDVPAGCCSNISIQNTGGVELSATDCNLIVERIA